jgi:hypothetical protein
VPTNDSFEFDYVPGYTKPTHEFGQPFGDEFHAEAVQELLLSMAGYTQRGVTLAPGQGVLPTGTVLARNTASGMYLAYRPSATDGCQTAVGVLRDSRDTGGLGYATIAAYTTANPTVTLAGGTQVFPASPSGKVPTPALGNLVIRGILNANQVSGQDTTGLVSGTAGGIGTAILTALGGRVVPFGGGVAGGPFPGGPMDGQFAVGSGVQTVGVSAFIF